MAFMHLLVLLPTILETFGSTEKSTPVAYTLKKKLLTIILASVS